MIDGIFTHSHPGNIYVYICVSLNSYIFPSSSELLKIWLYFYTTFIFKKYPGCGGVQAVVIQWNMNMFSIK